MPLTKPKKNGVHEIKCVLRKKWTTVGLREKKNRVKSKKLVTLGIRKKMLYNKIGYSKMIPSKNHNNW